MKSEQVPKIKMFHRLSLIHASVKLKGENKLSKIQSFTEEFITEVFKSFKRKEDQWCNLQNFSLHTVSYEDELHQEYYLLKYFLAYFTEYYHALENKFFTEYKKNTLKVISIGCGAGIDYYALNMYLNIKGLDIDLDYTCIDIIDWSYKPTDDNCNFIHSDINEIENNIFDNADLIIFPKILTELNNDTIMHIINLLKSSALKEEVYFLNSYITDNSHDNQRVNGIEQFKKICNSLQENGFEIDNNVDCDTYTHFTKYQGLRAIYDFFIYPQDILDIFNKLEKHCNSAQGSIECSQCDIGTFPIMKTNYIAYLVIKFKNDN